MQEAMQLVRLELGDQAVILNSKAVKKYKFFGLISKKSVEVIAAVDEEPPQPLKTKKNNVSTIATMKQIDPVGVQKTSPNLEQDRLLESILDMKKMMKSITKKNNLDPSLPDFFHEIEEKLSKTDVGEAFVEDIMESLYHDWQKNKTLDEMALLNLVEQKVFLSLEEVPFEENPYKKKFVCVVGPTGVGKTTTLAKLAANATLKHGKKIGFITTDTYRIAAIEQLKIYANILEAPVEVCYSAEDFKVAKTNLAHLDVVFIDTAGRNFLNGEFVNELRDVLDFQAEMTTYLVLALTSKFEDMKKITDQFWSVGIHQFVFTKKDETTSSSAMYGLSKLYKKGTAFVTDGQNVPEDLIPFTRELLAKSLTEELQK